MIEESEKKKIFDRLIQIEEKMDSFIPEAQGMINKSIEKINEINGRLVKLEKKVNPDGE